ncbi:PorP/SprF family type IX secretion system membrane protein [Chitinophaga sp. Cy-1792]|uniref:PorP/SprF family type IX secretion system membrane protein n=1 Tax=Chitinophaga sp. Cy-1792 TaxID=2608339 RepID=UPI00141FB5AB|nr:PorP/SprF family type IX secretion system membrane protein [Chitinophaga sp. Cy-1792]NIG56456.1 type IX secretion system membrane protein PorP/SprF [Chitinophaga sp. Cy-1792]
MSRSLYLRAGKFIITVVCCAVSLRGYSQSLSKTAALLDPSATSYFQNQYLANPAMAGVDTGWHFNASYRGQINGIEGAPVTQFFSGDGYVGARVGAGLNIFNDKAGLLARTRIAGSYAYHLPLNDYGAKLNFGLSLAMNFQRLDYSKINGDPNDPAARQYNNRDDYFEADFGMAYTDRHWTAQASLPNIRAMFTGKSYPGVDGGTVFFSALAYKFDLYGAVSSVTPKACFRSIKGYDPIIDVGLNVGFVQNVLNLTALYHTTGSFAFGVGVYVMNTVRLNAFYNTQTSGLRNYTDGTYEVGLTVDLFK